MRAAQASWVALLLTSGCLRFGYDVAPKRDPSPDAAHADAGAPRMRDAAVADAATRKPAAGSGGSATVSGSAGRGGAGGQLNGGAGAAGAAASEEDAGSQVVDPELGNSGLHVSEILGFYSGDWGDMLLRKQDREIWGAYKYNAGTIIGQITGEGVFVGWWTQLPLRAGLNAGEVEFRWSLTSATVIWLDGRWRYGSSGEWHDDWDVGLVTDRDAPSVLTDHFDTPNDFVRHP